MFFKEIQVCFAEFTLSSFASLRACPEQREGTVRSGRADGLSITDPNFSQLLTPRAKLCRPFGALLASIRGTGFIS